MSSWHSYPSVYALGHGAVKDLLLDPVLIEEKIDGSQFSFGRFDGVLKCRSKGQELIVEAPEKMFAMAVAYVTHLDLHNGWTYRAEWLSKPKHNVLAYDRTPFNGLMVFDINTDEETYLSWSEKSDECLRLGLEVAPRLFYDGIPTIDTIKALLETKSCLGGQLVEGVVVKNYVRFGLDKKSLMGKFVSERFKEIHANEWKSSNPTGRDILTEIGMRYTTPARWDKAVQHLRDAGTLEQSPRDIGALMKEIPDDVAKECEAEIKDRLWAWAWPHVRRQLTRGLPEWYKTKLLEKQFTS